MKFFSQFLVALCAWLPMIGSAQKIDLDSLFSVWNDKDQSSLERLGAMNVIAFSGYLYKDPDSAYYYAQKQLDLASATNSELHVSKALITQAESHRLRAKYSDAVKLLQRALMIKREIGDVRGEGAATYCLGLCYVSLGRSQDAVESYEQARLAYEQVKDSSGIAKSLIGLGNAHSTLSQLSIAQDYYERSLLIAVARADSQSIAYALTNVGRVAHDQGHFEEAVDHNVRAIRVFELIKDLRGLSGALSSLGAVLQHQGKVVAASESFLRSLRISETNGNQEGVAIALSNLGDLYFEQDELEQALEYFSRCYAICEKIGSKPGMIYTLDDIGNAYRNTDPLTSIGYYNRCLVLAQESGDTRMVGISLCSIGFAYQLLNELPLSLENYTLGLEAIERSGYQPGVALALHGLSSTYEKMGAYEKAIRYGLKALTLSQEIGAVKGVRDASDVLYRAFGSTGRAKQAVRYFKLYSTMSDSLQGIENQRAIAKRQVQFEMEGERTVDSLSNAAETLRIGNERAIARLSATERQRTSNAVGGVGLLVLLSGATAFALDRRRRKHLHARKAAKLETQAWRAQVNPQFIHTALNNINDYVQANERDLASAFLTRFARLMRAVLENARQEEVTLQSDLDVLRDYLELEKARAKDRFTYSIEVDPAIDQEDVMVPPMLLQPFAEEAIWKGLAQKSGIGHVTIAVRKQGAALVMTVEDDGDARVELEASDIEVGTGTSITKARLELLAEQEQRPAAIRSLQLAQGHKVEVELPYQTAA